MQAVFSGQCKVLLTKPVKGICHCHLSFPKMLKGFLEGAEPTGFMCPRGISYPPFLMDCRQSLDTWQEKLLLLKVELVVSGIDIGYVEDVSNNCLVPLSSDI